MPGKITRTPTIQTLHDRLGCQDMPKPEAYQPGTVWQCDECKAEWVVVQGAQYNEPYTAWRRLTDRNQDGQDN